MRDYATQMDAAKRGIVTPQMETAAKKENMEMKRLMELVACGQIAIPANKNHTSLSAEAVGTGTKTKINVNLGVSGDCKNYDVEMQKVDMAVKFGAEAIMDLSNYGKTNTFRRELIAKSPAMIGTVPMYDAIGYLDKDLLEISAEEFLNVIRAHAEEGVDFMTIHAGINRRTVEAFRREGRKMNIVSRGGSLLFAWMEMTGNENPFFEYYDQVLEILREYDVTISLGDALRPGCLADSSDAGQISELIELGNCYVTPAEHLRLPDLDDVKEGIIASKIAAHAADIAKGLPHAMDPDNQMAEARRKMDWDEMFEVAIDGEKARKYFESTPPADRHTCSMCGKMCAVRTTNMILEGKTVEFCHEK